MPLHFVKGLYRVDDCFSISWSFKNHLKALEINSMRLSNRNALISYSNYVFTSALNSLNFSKYYSLDVNVYNHTSLEKYSMKVTKYLAPPMDMVFMGPHTLECIISKGLVARMPSLFRNVALCYFLSMHASQTNKNVGQEILPRFMPLTMFYVYCQP